ncbi:hypothetical protein QBC39DRAFT_350094 [Podospora conica]|nr:hypothetical protein QBC39DRAFT_350094 [Schizothecium conicum]
MTLALRAPRRRVSVVLASLASRFHTAGAYFHSRGVIPDSGGEPVLDQLASLARVDTHKQEGKVSAPNKPSSVSSV